VEEAQEVEENRSRCLSAACWFFDDVLFSRIALTTLAQSNCTEVQEKDRGQTEPRE
jgi:hypothetical protein